MFEIFFIFLLIAIVIEGHFKMKTKTPKVKTFIVSRKKWHRGEGSKGSSLRLENGKQCCLGFVGRSLGIRVKNLLHCDLPINLSRELRELYPNLVDNNTWSDFSMINDDKNISDKEREQQLKALAKANGFRFKFVL